MNEVAQVLFSTADVIARMADEGLPVCAIARSLKVPSDEVREVLQVALDAGAIVEYPREDWPPGGKRSSRGPAFTDFLDTEEKLFSACSRYFHTTRQQSAVLGTLIRRAEATKVQLHQVIERDRPDAKEETDIKLVDVLICILRRKLRAFDLEIKTDWGRGYRMEAKERARALHELHKFMCEAEDPGTLLVIEEMAA